ncbi:hypothetical protein FOL47_006200, partial [Perkinsus chesapeaki]
DNPGIRMAARGDSLARTSGQVTVGGNSAQQSYADPLTASIRGQAEQRRKEGAQALLDQIKNCASLVDVMRAAAAPTFTPAKETLLLKVFDATGYASSDVYQDIRKWTYTQSIWALADYVLSKEWRKKLVPGVDMVENLEKFVSELQSYYGLDIAITTSVLL